MKNKLWLIANNEPQGVDIQLAHVICAPDAGKARQLAAEHARDEGRDLWLDETRSTCEILKPVRTTGIILTSALNG